MCQFVTYNFLNKNCTTHIYIATEEIIIDNITKQQNNNKIINLMNYNKVFNSDTISTPVVA